MAYNEKSLYYQDTLPFLETQTTDRKYLLMKRLGKKKRKYRDLAETYRGDGAIPACPHFGTCGGCLLQDIPYENQLLLKRDHLNTIMDELGQIDHVHPSRPYGYRTRMDMVTAFGKAGLREAGSFKFVVDVERCPLMQEKMERLFIELRPLLKEADQHNYLTHQGYLRYAVLRQAFFTGELMACFVVSRPENHLAELIETAERHADSVSVLLSEGLADLSSGPVYLDAKRGWIEESFDGTRYRITPNSFFQSNCEVARTMYSRIREEVRGRVLDLFCGVGSISLFAAKAAESVTGVEIVNEAVESARINCEINSITNAEFITGDACGYLEKTDRIFDTLVLDPPRSGMHPKAGEIINRKGPERIVYMSCNPSTFRDDLLRMTDYRLDSLEAYDMFPQTPHLETLAVLTRRK